MRLLLDTATFLFVCLEPRRLSQHAAAVFADPANDTYLSVVSAYEIATKHALGKLPLPDAPSNYVRTQRTRRRVTSLPLSEAAALAAGALPPVHRDPFDRLLIAQAITHGLTILTPDAALSRYNVSVTW